MASKTKDAKQATGQLLTCRDLAALLRLHLVTVQRLKAAGRLPPHVVIGGAHRWREDVILQWIEAGCPASGTVSKLK